MIGLKYKYKIEPLVGKLIQKIGFFVFETGDLMRFLKGRTPIPAESVLINQIILNLTTGH
jgi:hypothetical protein